MLGCSILMASFLQRCRCYRSSPFSFVLLLLLLLLHTLALSLCFSLYPFLCHSHYDVRLLAPFFASFGGKFRFFGLGSFIVMLCVCVRLCERACVCVSLRECDSLLLLLLTSQTPLLCSAAAAALLAMTTRRLVSTQN